MMFLEKIIVDKLVKYYPRNDDGRVNLSDIIAREGIILKMMPDFRFDNASGQFLEHGPDGKPTIYLNTNTLLTHQRFVLAHELGHYFLGHGSCVRDTKEQLMKQEAKEISANRFATELLMPTKKISEYVREFLTIKDMAERFRVSEQTMQLCLKSLNLM